MPSDICVHAAHKIVVYTMLETYRELEFSVDYGQQKTTSHPELNQSTP